MDLWWIDFIEQEGTFDHGIVTSFALQHQGNRVKMVVIFSSAACKRAKVQVFLIESVGFQEIRPIVQEFKVVLAAFEVGLARNCILAGML
ncbi:hypothetical protein [Paenibacillus rhizophilus]|uniref:Uncharacterized protein n=1 Tax=Paenibacillus rhizophilus TaxID=1850366 RepID=A0A3N9PAS9_9BACL|nr:hypothetical protein [Paenibacillus rhizophilus]RQW12094.1 hypothetical protein EH198_10630 [Paenibacillus rhizophilus]